jgi:hypothetical protein
VRRDGFALELSLLLASLVGGAALRYWLSTAVPFDASELARLAEAVDRQRGLRVPFIMLNGVSLLAFYLLVRRSAGVAAALAALLALQTSVAFQQEALRIRFAALPLLLAMVGIAFWRQTRPPGRLPRWQARGLAGLVALLALKGAYLGLNLPQRLEAIRRESTADPAALLASLERCGGALVTPLERLRDCAVAWPARRSLEQQEALLEHAQRVRGGARVLTGPQELRAGPAGGVAVFDPAAAALLVVPGGEAVDTARRVVRNAAPGFFAGQEPSAPR